MERNDKFECKCALRGPQEVKVATVDVLCDDHGALLGITAPNVRLFEVRVEVDARVIAKPSLAGDVGKRTN